MGLWSASWSYSLRVINVENGFIGDKTHLLVSIDGLNCENIIFTVHRSWGLKFIASVGVVSVNL